MINDLSKKIMLLEPESEGEMVDVFLCALKRRPVWYAWRDQFEKLVAKDAGLAEPKDKNHRTQGG